MTFGEKLSRLRKENNYTQEQIADLLEVSRQSVSKWESDLAYPETDKVIKLATLFDCSLDYLLKEETENRKGEESDIARKEDSLTVHFPHFEKKSKRTLFGLPLYHINVGYGRSAKGIIAIGLVSYGFVSIGLFSVGLLSIGLFAIGLLAFGVISLGIFSMGAVAIGIIALGAVSMGILSIGAMSVGSFSIGNNAIGHYFALGDEANAMVAIGRTSANGSLFSKAGSLNGGEASLVKALLDEQVPAILGWAMEIAKSFL